MKFNSNNFGKLVVNGKEIKIKKRVEVKVPKNATFSLNTHHCKVKLPNTIASGNIKYGSFDVNNLTGGRLIIDYAKVNINDLNACTLFLNNVTDAKITSVSNTNLSNNLSDLTILKINENVNVRDKFSKLLIKAFTPDFKEFVLNLSHSDVTVMVGKVPTEFKYSLNRVRLDNQKTSILNQKSNNLFKVFGAYSSFIIK